MNKQKIDLLVSKTIKTEAYKGLKSRIENLVSVNGMTEFSTMVSLNPMIYVTFMRGKEEYLDFTYEEANLYISKMLCLLTEDMKYKKTKINSQNA